jgi:hypothetical protein
MQFFSLCFKISILAILITTSSVVAQRKNKPDKDGFVKVYESGDPTNGYYYQVLKNPEFKTMVVYKIFEGNMVNGKLHGFGKTLKFQVDDDEKFECFKNTSDSSRAMNEINLLPKYYTASGKEEEAYTVKHIEYQYGQYYNGYLVRGTKFYGTKENREEGLFSSEYPYDLDYGTYTNKYRDTLVRGFICLPEIKECKWTGLRYFIADSSFTMIPYHQNEPIKDLYPYPMSEYNDKRKQVYNFRYNAGTYNGECYNGKPEGLGEWISDDGEFVRYGYFKNGVPHGLFCRNFPQKNWTTGKSDSDFYSKRPIKRILVGLYKNGKPVKVYMGGYIGEINENFLPHGNGVRENFQMGITERGTFAYGRLNGQGTRIDRDKNVESGEFKDGVLVYGSKSRSVYSLQKYEVVVVRGKKLMVVDKRSDGPDNVFAVLSDGTRLHKGDQFTISYDGNSEFFTLCSYCNGSGIVVKTNTYQLWTGGYDVSTSTKVERIGSQEYIIKNTERKPVYTERTSQRKESCMHCAGEGRFLKTN